ncbi:glycosyltransferase family 4 protein [Ilyomonas limi]|uniref:Glycosyltransferase family 4 protein n=1 Tax=Ilyomonas limi TaxID=2575867 RepID=A0A4U3KRW9_9BACT|nr:glycosyltransferase family 4 protein [Ilyomonas limi]TKK65022.1 glycosyltransferase family 4 protein [Ilyomonas limi]
MDTKNNSERTIHFFTKGDRNTASSRQRAYIVADKLKEVGLSCIVHEPFVNRLNKTKWPKKAVVIKDLFTCLLQVKSNDVIYLQRTVYSSYFINVLLLHHSFFKSKLVFDFDDAIFLHLPAQTERLTRKAERVIVGSHLLQEWAQQYNKHVYLLPTAIDFLCYSKYSIEYSEVKPITIGWIGHGPDHYENLEIFAPVIKACASRGLNIQLLIIGSLRSEKVKSLFSHIAGVTTHFIDSLDWSAPDVIPQALQPFDIGVMPLKNTEWNTGKCAFKAIEYMALGIPVVVSAIGENNYLIKNGINGFRASDTTEWADKLEQLICSVELRKKMGQCGQQTIKQYYAYHAIIPTLYNILQSV